MAKVIKVNTSKNGKITSVATEPKTGVKTSTSKTTENVKSGTSNVSKVSNSTSQSTSTKSNTSENFFTAFKNLLTGNKSTSNTSSTTSNTTSNKNSKTIEPISGARSSSGLNSSGTSTKSNTKITYKNNGGEGKTQTLTKISPISGVNSSSSTYGSGTKNNSINVQAQERSAKAETKAQALANTKNRSDFSSDTEYENYILDNGISTNTGSAKEYITSKANENKMGNNRYLQQMNYRYNRDKKVEKYEEDLNEKKATYEANKVNDEDYDLDLIKFSNANGDSITGRDYKQKATDINTRYQQLVNDYETTGNAGEFEKNYQSLMNELDDLQNYTSSGYNDSFEEKIKENNKLIHQLTMQRNSVGLNESQQEQLDSLIAENESLQTKADDVKTLQDSSYYEQVMNSGDKEAIENLKEEVSHYHDNVAERLRNAMASSVLQIGATAVRTASALVGTSLKAEADLLEIDANNLSKNDEDYQKVLDASNSVKKYANEVLTNPIREKLDEEIDKLNSYVTIGIDNPVEKFIYDGVTSTSNFYIQLHLLGEFGSLLSMAAQSGSERYYELVNEVDENGNQKYSDSQILANSVLTGLASFGTEKIGMDRFVELVSGKAGKYLAGQALNYVLKSTTQQAIAEGSEEVVEEIADRAINKITGVTNEDFNADDLMYSFAVGAFSGGLMGAKENISNILQIKARTNAQYNALTEFEDKLNELKTQTNNPELLASINNAINSAEFAKSNFKNESVLGNAVVQETSDTTMTSTEEAMQTLSEGLVPDVEETLDLNNQINQSIEAIDFITQQVLNDKGIKMNVHEYENLNKDGRAQVDKVSQYAEKLGLNVAFSTQLGSQIQGANIDGNILINPLSPTPQTNVLAHEITHNLENTKAYKNLVEILKSTGEYGSTYKNVANQYNGIGGANIDSETVAKYIENNMGDINVVKRLITYDNSFASRIVQRVGDMFDSNEKTKIANVWRDAFNEYAQSNDNQTQMAYSLNNKDSDNNELSEDQIEYFKNSKIRDDNGDLMPVYHTSGSQFSEFKPSKNSNKGGDYKFGDYDVNFFSTSEKVSKSYSENATLDVSKQNYDDALNQKGHPNVEAMENNQRQQAQLQSEIDNAKESIAKTLGIEEDEERRKKIDTYWEGIKDIEKAYNNRENQNPTVNELIEELRSYGLFWSAEPVDFKNKLIKLGEILDTITKEDSTVVYSDEAYTANVSQLLSAIDTANNIDGNYVELEAELEKLKKEYDKLYAYTEEAGITYAGYVNVKSPYVLDAEVNDWESLNGTKASEIIDRLISRNIVDDIENKEMPKQESSVSTGEWLLENTSDVNKNYLIKNPVALANFANKIFDISNSKSPKSSLYYFKEGTIGNAEDFDVDENVFNDSLETNDVVSAVIAINNYLGKAKYDGVVFKNVVDIGWGDNFKNNGDEISDVIATFNSNQFKFMDNYNPTSNSDIRYSLSEDENSKLSRETKRSISLLKNDLQEILGINQYRNKSEYTNLLNKAYLEFYNGGITQETYDSLYKVAYENAKTKATNDTGYNATDIRKYLKNNAIDWNGVVGDVTDKSDFIKSNFGSFKFSNDGFGWDTVMSEMQQIYPGLIDYENINSGKDFVDSVQEALKDIDNSKEYTVDLTDFDGSQEAYDNWFKENFDKQLDSFARYIEYKKNATNTDEINQKLAEEQASNYEEGDLEADSEDFAQEQANSSQNQEQARNRKERPSSEESNANAINRVQEMFAEGASLEDLYADHSFQSAWQYAQTENESSRDNIIQEINDLFGDDNSLGENKLGANDINVGVNRAVNAEYQYNMFKNGALGSTDNYNGTRRAPQSSDYGKTHQGFRTIIENEQIVDNNRYQQLKSEFINGSYVYEEQHNAPRLAEAKQRLEQQGLDKSYDNFMNSQVYEKKAIMNKYFDGIAIAMEMLNKNDARVGDVLQEIMEFQQVGADITQASRLLKYTTPEYHWQLIEKQLDKLQSEANKKWGNKAPTLQISGQLKEEFNNADNFEEREEVGKRIKNDLENQIPPTLLEQLNSWRYMAMLSAPTTHIRNIAGNVVMYTMASAKDAVGAGIEYIAQKIAEANGKGFERTKTIFNPFSNKGKKALQIADEAYSNIKTLMEGDEKYEHKAFSDNLKLLNIGNEFISGTLNGADFVASKANFKRAYAEYILANHLDLDNLNEVAKIRAQEYAIQEAKKDTFRNFSQFAKRLNEISKDGGVPAWAIDTLLPFKQTPINVLKRGVEYSPIGLMSTITKGSSDLSKGKITTTQFIDNLASGLTGTGVAMLGYFLASLGIFRTKDDDKDRKQAFDEANGEQDYSINVGNGSYTIDWLTPFIIPLSIGAETYNTLKDLENLEDFNVAEVAYNALVKVADPIIETTMLSNVSSALKSYANSEGERFGQLVSSAVTNYVSSYIPAIANKIAKTVDDTQRSTYSEKFGGKTWKKILNKIPFASKANEASIDIYGQEKKNVGGTFFGRLAYNMLSPGYYANKEMDSTDEELLRLYESTGETKVFPTSAKKTVTNEGQSYTFTDKEYTAYQKSSWSLQDQYIKEFINDEEYDNYTDEEKASIIDKIRSYAGEVAKDEFFKNRDIEYSNKTVESVSKALENDVSVSDYYITKDAYSNMSGDNKKSDYIDYLNDDSMSDKAKLYMYSQEYGDSKVYSYVSDMDWDDKTKLSVFEVMADTTADVDENGNTISNSKAKKVLAQYQELGVWDSIYEYVTTHDDVEWSSFGLTKTVATNAKKSSSKKSSSKKSSSKKSSSSSSDSAIKGTISFKANSSSYNGGSSSSGTNTSSNSNGSNLNLKNFTGANTVLNSSSKGEISQNGNGGLDDDYLDAYSKIFRKSLV